MRKLIIAGNWKMYKTQDEALNFIYDVTEKIKDKDVDVVICAPFVYLASLAKRQGEFIKIGAQNMYFEKEGAYTGEVSPLMLKSVGASYVIIGHSERRQIFKETDELVNLKIKAAFKNGLNPILCIGETLEERENGTMKKVLSSQLLKDLEGLTPKEAGNLIIAYEPIWAIGTGKTATSKEAEEAALFIRETLTAIFDEKTSNKIRIQYGGSVKPTNIEEILSEPNVDGALIGGASLDADSFVKMVEMSSKDK